MRRVSESRPHDLATTLRLPETSARQLHRAHSRRNSHVRPMPFSRRPGTTQR